MASICLTAVPEGLGETFPPKSTPWLTQEVVGDPRESIPELPVTGLARIPSLCNGEWLVRCSSQGSGCAQGHSPKGTVPRPGGGASGPAAQGFLDDRQDLASQKEQSTSDVRSSKPVAFLFVSLLCGHGSPTPCCRRLRGVETAVTAERRQEWQKVVLTRMALAVEGSMSGQGSSVAEDAGSVFPKDDHTIGL